MEGKKLKRQRRSKKSKRSWRKHTDVQDVEEYLQDRQREEVVGVPAAEKLDEQLFFVHNDSSPNDSGDLGKAAEVGQQVERLSVRRRKRPLKTDMYLQPISAVEGFPVRKRRAIRRHKQQAKAIEKRDKDSRLNACCVNETAGVCARVDSSSEDDEWDKSAAYSEIRHQQLAKLKEQAKRNPPKPVHKTVMKDLWADSESAPIDEEAAIPDEHYLRVTRKMPIKKPATMHGRPSAIESVQVPHPGMSYNPTFEDHQSLLRAALDVEEEREKATQKLENKLQLAKLTHQEREKVWLEEMTQGILDNETNERGMSDNEEGEGRRCVLAKRPVRADDRKTKKQRRKERERKKEEQQRRLEKLKKSKMDEIFRLRSIKREIAEQEASISEKKKTRDEEERDSVLQTKRLGKLVFEEPDLEVKLSSEISGSLHSLKPEGNLAMDRFKSLQRRNVIEPRQMIRPSRKYKLKVKEKWSARLPEESQFN